MKGQCYVKSFPRDLTPEIFYRNSFDFQWAELPCVVREQSGTQISSSWNSEWRCSIDIPMDWLVRTVTTTFSSLGLLAGVDGLRHHSDLGSPYPQAMGSRGGTRIQL